MKWIYKTVHFELKKEGLLGVGFLDESEIEHALNDYGKSGWEVISVLEVQDGVIVFFKQPLGMQSGNRYHEEDADAGREETVETAAPPDDERFRDDKEDAGGDASKENSTGKKNEIGAIRIE